MKKRQPSPFIASMMQKFQEQSEHSPTTPITPKTSPKEQKPPLPEHPEETLSTRATPQRPPRARDKQQSQTTAQENETANTRAAPQRPPRARDKQQSQTTTQESGTANLNVAPQRPPRARDKQQSQTGVQQSAGLYPKVILQKPPRAKSMQTSSTSSQESENLYATPAPPTPPKMRDRRGMQTSSTSSQDSEGLYATPVSSTPPKSPRIRKKELSNPATPVVASSRISISLSQEEIILKVKNNMLVQTCKDEIKSLSQTVYGNPDIFENKLADIEKNPILGESLSWQVAENPALVARLAGKKILGVKSKTRKEAEKQVASLCLALENYADTVKQAKENIFQSHIGTQTRHRTSIDLKEIAEDLQKPRKPEQEMVPLSHKEIARRVKSHTSVKYCHAEVVYWCTVAYKDPGILQYRLETIEKSPAEGEQLAWQVTNYPNFFGKLAGYDFHGFKSNARKQAENALTHLGNAIEGYAEAVKNAKENILEKHQEKQKRHAHSSSLEKSLQKQQLPSESPKQPEHSSENLQQKAAEAFRQADNNPPDVQPRRAELQKTMAFTR
ncbi:BID domain-containing T4SS effector [Bartonella vinsonii]|uniref:Bep protein n=1 Tax=Bartonella vinsonii subsp. berkhoffii str. Tweed TaxID=1094502 RepID=N6VN16_BARVB|nr:BID domain-containing T4SS effector [Bartonella vinsonii]AGF76317.1 Bep protein [Bartonella vinsonii subsp. berkhoffii str. Winnie]ENN94556.1 Bep protein [Bartonella vinsonii subsp. berkhoffii str. Tweed]